MDKSSLPNVRLFIVVHDTATCGHVSFWRDDNVISTKKCPACNKQLKAGLIKTFWGRIFKFD